MNILFLLLIITLLHTPTFAAPDAITSKGFAAYHWGMTKDQIISRKTGRVMNYRSGISFEGPNIELYGMKIETMDFWIGDKGLSGIAIQLSDTDYKTLMRTISSHLGRYEYQSLSGYNWLVGHSIINAYTVGTVTIEYSADPNQFKRLAKQRSKVVASAEEDKNVEPVADTLFQMLEYPYFVTKESLWSRNHQVIVSGLTKAGYSKKQIRDQLYKTLKKILNGNDSVRNIVRAMKKEGLITEKEEFEWLKASVNKNLESLDVSEYIDRLLKMNRPQEAFKVLITFCEEDSPCNVDSSRTYLKLFMRYNKQKKALLYLDRCGAKWPNNKNNMRGISKSRGYLYCSLGEYKKAAINFEKSIRIGKGYVDYLYFDMGKAFLMFGDYPAAIRSFKRYIDRYPNAWSANSKIIILLTTSKDKSLRDGRLALNLSQNLLKYRKEKKRSTYSAYRMLAYSYAELNHFQEAIQAQKKAIESVMEHKVKPQYQKKKEKYIDKLKGELRLFEKGKPIRNENKDNLRAIKAWYDR